MRQILTNLLNTPPMRFQVSGVHFLERHNGRAILGDDMGLGKTYQALAYMKIHPEIRPVIVVCPSTAKLVWKQQLWQHGRIQSEVLYGSKAGSLKGNVWIVNFDILDRAPRKGKKKERDGWLSVLERAHPRLLIIDEAHRAGNRKAVRTKACRRLARRCQHVLGLSGTPMRHRPVQFFPVLNMVAPRLFPSFIQYANEFCDPKPGFRGRGMNYSGASNLEELHRRVSEVMIRRTKAQVMQDLPRKSYTTLPVEIDNWKDYQEAQESIVRWYLKNKGSAAAKRASRATAFVRLQTLLQLAALGKVPALVSWVKDWLEDTGEKLVVFTTHTAVLRAIHKRFPDAAMIDGSVRMDLRDKEVTRFQNDPRCRLFIGNLQAAGESITLHAASTVLFAELGWVPTEHDQAEDRVLRIGQKANHVDIYYMIGADTVEELVMESLDRKQKTIDRVVDGCEREDVRTIVLEKLVRRLT